VVSYGLVAQQLMNLCGLIRLLFLPINHSITFPTNTYLHYTGISFSTQHIPINLTSKISSLHSFRLVFTINMLHARVDVFSIQMLMGHADLQVLRRYLAQTTEDIAQEHRIGSPEDNAGF
jgi:integrase